MEPKSIISIVLAFVALVGVGGAIWNRNKHAKGIGWQFIRYSAIITAIPIVGILALNDSLNDGGAAILAGALGYAFGKQDDTDA